MPKRVLKLYLNNISEKCKESISVENTVEQRKNIVEEDDNDDDDDGQSKGKRMRYMPSNQNNEVERLLLHNSARLLFHVDHGDFPAFNVGMWPQENCDMLTYYPKCAFSVPRPIYVPNKQCEKIDICYKRPMNQHRFKSSIRMTRTCYQTALKNNKNIRSSIKEGIYHYSLFDLAERLYMQPDPFFHSSYDFYFTGGNLCVLPLKQILLHAGGENLQEMLISGFPVADESTATDSLKNFGSLKSSGDCEIFEYHPFLTSPNSSKQNCFIARQRNLVGLNYVNDANQIKSLTQFRTNDTPFISFAQSERDRNNFIITTMKQHVRLYDLNSNVPALVKLFEISPKSKTISWNTVKPWRENTFLYANQKEFFMIDIRTSPEQWLKEVNLANDHLNCDHISAVMPSDFNNLFYVATSHRLRCMDSRYLKSSTLNDSGGGICTWTHQLQYPPTMMDTFRLRQTEYVALSSPIAGDLHICQLSRERNDDNICMDSSITANKHIYSSPCLPYQPPTLFESYEHARLSGKCLRPESNLEARIKCCTTGMKFFESETNLNSGIGLLLIANSNGDIYAHTLSKREDNKAEERCNKQSDDIMKDFEEKLCQQSEATLNFTEIKNMKGLRKVFLCRSLSAIQKIDIDAMGNEYTAGEEAGAPVVNNTGRTAGKANPKRLHLGRWQKPLSTLHSYKDALVSDLLSVWDIDVLEENHIRLGKLQLPIKMEPALKVENWLKQNTPSAPPMLTIPSEEITRYTENPSTSNIFANSRFNLNQTQATVEFEKAVHSTQLVTEDVNISAAFDKSFNEIPLVNDTTMVSDKLKNSKKKTKKYVKGF